MIMIWAMSVTAMAAAPDAWVLLQDGRRLPGQPIGRSARSVTWQLSDGGGYAEITIPLESIQAIQWRLPLIPEEASPPSGCDGRHNYLDLLDAADKRRVFEHCMGQGVTRPEGMLRLVRTLQLLREGKVPPDLFRSIVAEECVALIQLQLAHVAVATVALLDEHQSEAGESALSLYVHAAAAVEAGALRQALHHAVAGFLRYGADDDRWRSKCAALAIYLMETQGMVENAYLTRRSAESQRLQLDAVSVHPHMDGGGVR